MNSRLVLAVAASVVLTTQGIARSQTTASVVAGGRKQAPSLEEADRQSALRSMARNARLPHPYAGTCPPTDVSLSFTGVETGTGIPEIARIGLPCGFDPLGPDLPLLVFLNGYCLGANAIFNGITQIPDEASARGWISVAINQGADDGAYEKKSYGIFKTQPNVEFIIDYVIQNYPVDEDRIYGLGFSAGGGAIASYAARHLDPTRPMFAAVAVDAGTVDLVDSYTNVDASVKSWMSSALMFNGTPQSAPFSYLRSLTVRFDAAMTADESVSQVRNLVHTPILHVYSTDDQIPYLPAQNIAFAAYLSSRGAPITSIPFTGLFESHSWDLLDPVTTLDFFAAQTVERAPESFDVLIDRDARYYWADVTLRDAGTFATVTGSIDAGAARVTAEAVSNVASVTLSPPPGVDLGDHFELRFQTEDSGTTSVSIAGVPVEPTYLLRGSSVFKDWSYDSPSSTLTLALDGPAVHTIRVRFDDYAGVLSGPTVVVGGAQLSLVLSASAANKPYVLFLGLSEGVIPTALFDPGDDRNLLVGFGAPPALVQGLTNGAGQSSISFQVPASLAGMMLRCQFASFPGGATVIDEISNRLDVSVTSM